MQEICLSNGAFSENLPVNIVYIMPRTFLAFLSNTKQPADVAVLDLGMQASLNDSSAIWM